MTSHAQAIDTPERQRACRPGLRRPRASATRRCRSCGPSRRRTAAAAAAASTKEAAPDAAADAARRSASSRRLGTIKEGSLERGSEDVKKPEEPKKKKKGLLARIRRGVAKRINTSSTTKPRAWEPTQKRKPAPKKKGRLSEQPFAPTDFERRRVLGRGGFGVVYLVEKKLAPDQGRNYAMKVLDKHKLLKGGQRSQARLERDVLRVVRHPFVARLRVSFQTETRLYLYRTSTAVVV